MRAFLLLLLAIGALSAELYTYPRIRWIGEIDASDLFNPPDDPTNPFSPWRGPLDAPLQKPQSYRTHYVFWNSKRFTGGADLFGGSTAINTLEVVLSAPVTIPTTLNFKLEAPYLELDPYGCNGNAKNYGSCRCNPDNGITISGNSFDGVATPSIPGATDPTNLVSRRLQITIPNWSYFEHAPYPGQHPLMRTYRKLCYRGSTVLNQFQPTGYYVDTTVWIAVVHACDVTGSTSLSCGAGQNIAGLSYSWNQAPLPDTNLGTWRCNSLGYLGEFFDYTAAGAGATNPIAIDGIRTQSPDECWGESREMKLARDARTTCCGARDQSTTGLFGIGGVTNVVKYGTCYNPQVDNCCGWKPYNPKFEKCCSKPYARINYLEQHCKCSTTGELFECQMQGSNLFSSAADKRGESDAPVATNKCCPNGVTAKYPELATINRFGFCYSTLATAQYKCCDDGQIYDPGAKQCCPINGVQSINVPCPCNRDTDCPTNNLDSVQKCCLQQWPKSWDNGQGPNALGFGKNQCDKYANWPDGTAPVEMQRCHGSCFDSAFQTCCNGQLCVREYERCCNSTCCNRFTSGCMEGTRPGTLGAGARINPKDYAVDYELCSSIEVFTTRRAFWVWVMPTFWLAATVASLAVVIVVARRATENQFDLNEKAMVFFAVCLIGLNVGHYFSPTFKYGIVICFVSLFTIVGAVMRSKAMSIVVVVLIIGLILYWIDPFEGNIYLSLTGGTSHAVQSTEAPNFGSVGYTSGIIEALFRIDRNRTECTGFYDYFQLDPFVRDFERFYNPNKMTFGFCTRAWMSALFIFSLTSMAIILVLLILSINSVAKKIVPQSTKDDLTFNVQPVNEFPQ